MERSRPAHPLSSRFGEAVAYALAHHADQIRKGTSIPYAAHVLSVSALVLEMETGNEDEAIAGLLHDVVEDGGGLTAAAEIEERFGPEVARIVLANSDSTATPKPPWRARKEAYLEAVRRKQPDELRVSVADKLHNARAILMDYRRVGDALWARFTSGKSEDVVWYYEALVREFQARRGELGDGGAAALDELSRVVVELTQEIKRRQVSTEAPR